MKKVIPNYHLICNLSAPLISLFIEYCKVPKFSGTHLLYSKHSKFQINMLYHGVMLPNDANEIANRSSLILVCTVLPSLSVGKHDNDRRINKNVANFDIAQYEKKKNKLFSEIPNVRYKLRYL